MIKKTLRPCDCKDENDCNSLDANGIGFNDNSIEVQPNLVLLSLGHTTVKMPMKLFKKFAEWYLEEQLVKPYNEVDNDTFSD